MALDTTLNAALSADAVRAFLAVRIELPATPSFAAYTINLIDGSGVVTFPVNGNAVTFTGEDPTFGTLGTASSVSEAVATEAPSMSITLLPPTSTATGQLNQPQYQGARVYVWFGGLNETTGLVIGSPELLYSGRLDTVKTTSAMNTRAVEINLASVFDRLFTASEGSRLSKRWHRANFPAEGGLDHNIEGLANVPWGVEANTPAISVNTAKVINGLFGNKIMPE